MTALTVEPAGSDAWELAVVIEKLMGWVALGPASLQATSVNAKGAHQSARGEKRWRIRTSKAETVGNFYPPECPEVTSLSVSDVTRVWVACGRRTCTAGPRERTGLATRDRPRRVSFRARVPAAGPQARRAPTMPAKRSAAKPSTATTVFCRPDVPPPAAK